jgi:hypothetical protein
VLDGLALGIEHGALRHNPDMCFHLTIITFTSMLKARRAAADYFSADVALRGRWSAALAFRR